MERLKRYITWKVKDIEFKNMKLKEQIKAVSCGFHNLDAYQKLKRQYEDNEIRIDSYKNVLCEIEISETKLG